MGSPRPFHQSAFDKEHDVPREAPGLPQVVCRHDDLHALGSRALYDVLDCLGRSRVEAGGRLIQKKDLGFACQCAGKCQPLLLAAGQASRRPPRQSVEPDTGKKRGDGRGVGAAASGFQCERHVPAGRAAKHYRALKHDGARSVRRGVCLNGCVRRRLAEAPSPA